MRVPTHRRVPATEINHPNVGFRKTGSLWCGAVNLLNRGWVLITQTKGCSFDFALVCTVNGGVFAAQT